ncbi:MAG TPA: hypothetical protein VGP93_00310, partial [Polyangiaceae bacterium]|nr:hypothetical protein [Polyangiaceae bacterium]
MPRPSALLGPVLAGLVLGQSSGAWAQSTSKTATADSAGKGASAPPPASSAKPASPPFDPKRGVVTRKVEEPPVAADKGAAKPASKTKPEEDAQDSKSKPEPKKDAPRAAHQKGKPPRKPAANLPPGAARPEPDAEGRRQIAGGPTPEELRGAKDDPELRTLRE